MIILRALIVLLMAAPAFAAISYVQGSSMTFIDSTTQAESTMTVTAGNTLIVACSESDSTCPQVVVDTQNNVFTKITSALNYNDVGVADRCATVWVATVTTSGSTRITCYDTVNYNVGQTGVVHEYSGVNVNSPVDVYSSSATVAPTANPTAGSMSVAQAGNLIFSYLYSFENPSGSGNGTERKRYASAAMFNSSQDYIATSAGSYTANWTATAQYFPFTMIQVSLQDSNPAPPGGMWSGTGSGTIEWR